MVYNVVVWGPGNVGGPAIRSVLSNPQLALAGVIVHSEEKDGVDCGVLAGLDPIGLPATRNADAALAAGPDALVYAVNSDFRPAESIAECCAALAQGINVVTAGMYGLLHPSTADPTLRERFESACHDGGTSFLTSGIDPGFAMDLLPCVLTGVCQEIREVRMIENFNYAHYDQPDAVRNLIGFGRSMDETPPMLIPAALESVWGGSLRALAEVLDLELSGIDTIVERHALEADETNAMGLFEKGSQGAFRFEVRGLVAGEPKLVIEHITRIADETAPQWARPAKQGYHQVRITGQPDLVVTVECEDAEGNHAGGGNSAAAARLVNAIPSICEAAPGLIAGIDLPLISGRGLVV